MRILLTGTALCATTGWATNMGVMPTAGQAARFLKAEMKRADVTYAELAARLKDHELEETEASITSKPAPGTFAATFMLAAAADLAESIILAGI